MYICHKCNNIIQTVESKTCPHCRLNLFNEEDTTWIGSSDECNIIIKRDDIPAYAAAIVFVNEPRHYELYNLVGESFNLYKNWKKVRAKEYININEWMKIQNIILDFNHPKISPIFEENIRINFQINFDNLETFVVGSTDNAHIPFGKLSEQKEYAEIVKFGDNYFYKYPANAEPSELLTPIFINEYKLKIEELKLIDENDNIYIGDVKFPFSLIPNFLNDKRAFFITEKFPIEFEFDSFNKSSIRIGQSNCDIELISDRISYQHLEIKKFSEEHYWIKDLDSTYGTYIDSRKIDETQISLYKNVIFGDFMLKLIKRENKIYLHIDHLKGKIRLDANRITRKVKDIKLPFFSKKETLLNDIAVSIAPGEFVAIMGPSGSGKTTFLKILSGVDKIDGKGITGNVFYNYTDISKNYNDFRYDIAYLPQDDILFPELTVYECLYYAARLRLPHLKIENIDSIIDNILLGLDLGRENEDGSYSFPIKNKRIGDINKFGALSGGQRKRVNLAVELLSDPSILFLDEPTTGLSSFDSEKLVNLLVNICNAGSTIITTIHQPSVDIFKKFNKILILNKGGNVAYFGSAQRVVDYFERRCDLKYESSKNPANYILKALSTRSAEYWREEYLKSEAYEYFIHHQQINIPEKAAENASERKALSGIKISNFKQFLTLSSRNLVLKMKNHATLGLLLLQAPIIALLLGMIFSGILQDGYLLSDSKPEQEFIRLENYSRPTSNKYLPPINKDIKIYNHTKKRLFFYTQIYRVPQADSSLYKTIGPFQFSYQNIEPEDNFYFPIKNGNYFLSISDSLLTEDKIGQTFKLPQDNNSNDYYYIFKNNNDPYAINDWRELSNKEKTKIWQDNILTERKAKSELEDSLFRDFKFINSSSFLAFLNPVFDNIQFWNNIKKYQYTVENKKYDWYDASYQKKFFYVGDQGYREDATKILYLVFLMIISFIWIGMTNGVKDIVLERQILIRERRYTLKIFNYLSSKYVSLFVISLIQILLFMGVLYLFIHNLPISGLKVFVILLMTAMVSGGMGLIISSLAGNIEFAISTLPIILIPQIIFAGVFKHIGAMGSFLRFISSLNISRWSLESFITAISQTTDFESPFLNLIVPFSNIIYPCYSSTVENGKTILHGYFPFVYEIDLLILGLFLIVLFIASIFVLKLKK